MKARLMVLGVLLLGSVSGSAIAGGGLVQALPEDGVWVKYLAEVRYPAGGPDMAGTVTLRVIGKEAVQGETYRWLELEMRLKSNDREEHGVFKALFRETDLKNGGKNGLKIARGWNRTLGAKGTSEAKPLQGIEKASKGPLGMYFGCPMTGPAVVNEPHAIDYQRGRLQIKTGIAGRLDLQLEEKPRGASRVFINQKIWKHKTVPTGVARLEIEAVQDGMTVQHVILTVQDFGKGARSTLPGKK